MDETVKIRELAIALLTDENGISEEAYSLLLPLLKQHNCQDIINRVEAVDNRFYLPE